MSKIKSFIGGYIGKFYGEKGKHRNNKYLLVNKKGGFLDYNGYLETRREFHDYYEMESIEAVNKFLDEEVAKSERENWTCYKRYEKIPIVKSKQKEQKG